MSSNIVIGRVLSLSRKAGLVVARRMIQSRQNVVISDDCWGGEYYKTNRMPFLSPTIGLLVRPECYIDFIKLCLDGEELTLNNMEIGKDAYPVGYCHDVEIQFQHYHSIEEAERSWNRRVKRMNEMKGKRILFKIDFGKPGYSEKDIKSWNSLNIVNSIALRDADNCRKNDSVHSEVQIKNWINNGVSMYYLTRTQISLLKLFLVGSISRTTKFEKHIYSTL
ncbi:MAG: DUF1919 domain-containing protein [Bacteroidota bacterium]